MAAEPLVAYHRREYPEYHEYLDALFAAVKARPRIVEEHADSAGLVTAIEAGEGVALVAQSLACSTGARLKLIPLTPAPPPLVVGAAWRSDGPGTDAEHFLRLVRTAAANPQPLAS